MGYPFLQNIFHKKQTNRNSRRESDAMVNLKKLLHFKAIFFWVKVFMKNDSFQTR